MIERKDAGWRVPGWRVHGVLLALILVQLVLWGARHRSDQEWVDLWAGESGARRARAAHVLLSRSAPSGQQLGSEYLASIATADPRGRLRSLGFSSDVCKFTGPDAQLRTVVEGLEAGRPGALVDFILQCRKVGGASVGSSSAMGRKEVGWYFRAHNATTWPEGVAEEILAELAPSLDAIRAYLGER